MTHHETWHKPIKTSEQKPEKGVPVFVAGGVACMKTGGDWYSGMDQPPYSRKMQWEPEYWMPMPTVTQEQSE